MVPCTSIPEGMPTNVMSHAIPSVSPIVKSASCGNEFASDCTTRHYTVRYLTTGNTKCTHSSALDLTTLMCVISRLERANFLCGNNDITNVHRRSARASHEVRRKSVVHRSVKKRGMTMITAQAVQNLWYSPKNSHNEDAEVFLQFL